MAAEHPSEFREVITKWMLEDSFAAARAADCAARFAKRKVPLLATAAAFERLSYPGRTAAVRWENNEL